MKRAFYLLFITVSFISCKEYPIVECDGTVYSFANVTNLLKSIKLKKGQLSLSFLLIDIKRMLTSLLLHQLLQSQRP